MTSKKTCTDCGKPLTKDEIALNKKLINKDTLNFLCLHCLSEALECTEDDLKIKIEEFKEQGCTLFT